ncbi:MAG TPA: hypothetical protein VMJ92_04955 [Candidatus Limnocylindrales bacterium]|nr:hypothetical protein [Candidatus Limnocylindrales bacterium]
MELLAVLGVVVAVDLLAMRFGYDSTELGPIRHHERAAEAIRLGDIAGYESALRDFEREAARLRLPL